MIPKVDAMRVHRDLVRQRKYVAASILLRGLRDGYIRLGLGDNEYAVEYAISQAGGTFGINPSGTVIYCRVN